MDAVSVFKKLADQYSTPKKVQAYLRALNYNRELKGPTVRSALSAYQHQEVHCLEACFLAAAILEHKGYEPKLLCLDSSDNLCHTVFIFKTKTGWGSIGRSREPGLHGRDPVFKTIKQLSLSYDETFVDKTGSLIGYNVINLDDAHCNWRGSKRNVWKADRYTTEPGYLKLVPNAAKVKRLRKNYFAHGPIQSGKHWW